MKLRYFCDLCGTEVPRNTVRCPNCGRYFTAIQCPRCGFQGEEKDFAEGCPSCGYMKISRASAGTKRGRKPKPSRARRTASRKSGARQPGARQPVQREIEQPEGPSAPAGLYKLIGIILGAILIALVLFIFLR
jgi:predicted RNA-binding Zn-ribbon protein involved in translation (DUF1610 family)